MPSELSGKVSDIAPPVVATCPQNAVKGAWTWRPPQTPMAGRTEPSTHIFQPGPTHGALQGDDYPLEFYPDGYPKTAALPRLTQT